MSSRLRALLPYLALVVVVVAMLNFFWFMAESISTGTASTGRIVNGHYFLNNHGTYTEVSRDAWEWSRLHEISTFLTHPLAMVSMGYLLFRFAFPAMMGSVDPVATSGDAASIRSSGPPLATGRTSGRIGGLTFGGPLVAVSVYRGGIVIKPVFMPERAIPLAAIQRITTQRSRLGDRVVVEYIGPGSPLVVVGRLDRPVATAIVSLAPTTVPETLDRDAETAHHPGLSGAVSRLLLSFRAASDDGMRAFDAFPPGVGEVLFVFGMAVTGVMLAFAVVWAIPKLGLGGYVWTAGLIAITVFNTWQFLRRR
jgi:hypothetical protein